MSLPEQIASASKALATLASIHMESKLPPIKHVRDTLDHLTKTDKQDGYYDTLRGVRKQADEVAYVVEHLCRDLDGHTFESIPAILAGVADYQQRTYPPVPTDVGVEMEILADLLEAPEGVYLEVGAWRPQEQSNSWQFYERGWRGVLVEPIPQAWPALLANRVGDCLYPFALSSKPGYGKIWANGPTSSLRPDQNPVDTCQVVVETRTLAQLVAEYSLYKIDLCTIDVEGWEDSVFAGCDWDTFRPQVLMVECLDDNANWRQAVDDQGYREIARTEKNLILRAP